MGDLRLLKHMYYGQLAFGEWPRQKAKKKLKNVIKDNQKTFEISEKWQGIVLIGES